MNPWLNDVIGSILDWKIANGLVLCLAGFGDVMLQFGPFSIYCFEVHLVSNSSLNGLRVLVDILQLFINV